MADIIRIEGLNKTFHGAAGEITALADIDLAVREGEIFGIIGLSGAGKSTLVRCLNLLEQPTAGRVIVDGRDLSAMSKRELLQARQQMGMIFQGFHLLMQKSILDNVCFPLELAGISKKEARPRAQALLDRVGLGDRASAFPAQLSGGEQQAERLFYGAVHQWAGEGMRIPAEPGISGHSMGGSICRGKTRPRIEMKNIPFRQTEAYVAAYDPGKGRFHIGQRDILKQLLTEQSIELVDAGKQGFHRVLPSIRANFVPSEAYRFLMIL